MRILFAASLILLVYTYAGYPLLMLARARLRPRPWGLGPSWRPSLTVLLPVRNEAPRLCAKLESLLDQDWPRDAIEVLVLDDGSQDDTAELARIYEPWNVRLVRLPSPRGKAAALNLGAAEARGEVLVLTDARQTLEARALERLVAPLADGQVGAVSGELHLARGDGGLGLYRRLDDALRHAEARTGSSVGVTGALWALRRSAWRDLPEGTILDDLALPLCVARQGLRVVFEPEARVRDVASPDPTHELRRRARTLAGNLQLLRLLPWTFSTDNPLLFRLVSHKLLRLVAPLALVTLFVSNAFLVAEEAAPALSGELLALQIALYGLAALAPPPWAPPLAEQDAEDSRLRPALFARIARLARSFVLVHVAAVWAAWSFACGREKELWRPAPARARVRSQAARKRPAAAAATERP